MKVIDRETLNEDCNIPFNLRLQMKSLLVGAPYVVNNEYDFVDSEKC